MHLCVYALMIPFIAKSVKPCGEKTFGVPEDAIEITIRGT